MYFKFVFVWLALLVITSGTTSCTTTRNDEKIPVTTSSPEARELYMKGLAFADKLRPKDALVYFQQAVEKDSNFALAYLGMANNAQGPVDFFKYIVKAESLGAKVSEGERLLISFARLGTTGEIGKQTAVAEKLVTMFPKDERAHDLRGRNYQFRERKLDKSIEEYKKAIAINPTYSTPYNWMGYAYSGLEQYNDAENAFKKYIELIPDDPNPYDSYAEILMKEGKFDASIENYQKAIDLQSGFINSYLGIACDYIFKKEYSMAMDELEKMYQVAKNDGERRLALFGKTLCYVDQNMGDEAVKELEKSYAVAERANDAGNMATDCFNMGLVLLSQNKTEQAQKKFDQGSKISEASGLSNGVKKLIHRGYLFNSAQAAIQKHAREDAVSKIEEFTKEAKAIDNDFQLKGTGQLKGMLALSEKSFDSAVSELQGSNLQDPYNLYLLSQAYEGKGEKKKAKEMYDKALNFNAFANINQVLVRSMGKKE